VKGWEVGECSTERSCGGGGKLGTTGRLSASSAQSKCGVGSSMGNGMGLGCCSGDSDNSLCRRVEQEAWNSGWGFVTMVGSRLIEASIYFNVCGCSLSGGSVCVAAILCPGLQVAWVLALMMAGLAVAFWVSTSAVGVVVMATVSVWVLTLALVVISEVVVAEVVAVIGGDMAVAQVCSRHEKRGWEVFCGAVNRLGRVCHCFRGVGSCGEAVEAVVVAIVDNVGIIDGGCVDVISSDVAALIVEGGLVTRAVVLFSVRVVASVVFVVVCILKSTWSTICAFFSELGLLSSSSSI
jgi:hypothetical protein